MVPKSSEPPGMVLKPVVNGINYLSLNCCVSRFLHLPGALGALAFALLLATCLRSVVRGHGTGPTHFGDQTLDANVFLIKKLKDFSW